MESTFRIFLTIVFTGIWLIGLRWIWTNQLDPRATVSRLSEKALTPPDWVATRDPNKIYQTGHAVGNVTGPVEKKPDQFHFAQIVDTTEFDRSHPFEYQRLTLRVNRVGSISGMKSEVSEKGSRVLNAVIEDMSCTIVK